MISTCPYTRCPGGGIPTAVNFTLTATAVEEAATGKLGSDPDRISLKFGGDAASEYPEGTGVTLTADPNGRHARAVFSGACSGAGEYGVSASCRVTMSANRSVTVTYQCEPGFTCLDD